MAELSDVLTVQNALLVISVVGAVAVIRSKHVKELLEAMKALGSVQKDQIQAQEKTISDLKEELEQCETTLRREKRKRA